MPNLNRVLPLTAAFLAFLLQAGAAAEDGAAQARFLSSPRQLTIVGRRAGEGYFSPDGRRMVFQSEREPGNPFFQIQVLDLSTGTVERVSPGIGKSTCAWLHADGRNVLFASTHEDPAALAKQEEENNWRASGGGKRHSWDYDEQYDIFQADLAARTLTNLTHTLGYDAEGSWSPDGKLIAFASNRVAYAEPLSEADKTAFEADKSYMMDIYSMAPDGSDVRRLTTTPGYDGGPFFGPGGRRICWRRFTPDGRTAEIWTMNADGSDQQQITRLGVMSWAPFYHPSGDYLIFTTNQHGFANFELYIVDAAGQGEPVRVTWTDGADVLPAFTPDGAHLAWTCNRTVNQQGQIFLADWNDAAAREALHLPVRPAPAATTAPALSVEPPLAAAVAAAPAKVRAALDGQTAQPWAERIAEACKSLGLTAVFPDGKFLRRTEGEADVAARWPSANTPKQAPILVGVLAIPPADERDKSLPRNVTALLEVAAGLRAARDQSRWTPCRDVVFAVWLGGAHGAARFARLEEVLPPPAAYVDLGEWEGLDQAALVCGLATSPRWSRQLELRNALVGAPLLFQDEVLRHSPATYFVGRNAPSLNLTKAGDARTAGYPPRNDVAERLGHLATALVADLAEAPQVPPFTKPVEGTSAPAGSPYLGTEPDFTADVASGVKLAGVASGGPAERAGLHAGDIIVELNGQPVPDLQAYARLLAELKAGSIVTVVVLRDGQRVTIPVPVGTRP